MNPLLPTIVRVTQLGISLFAVIWSDNKVIIPQILIVPQAQRL